MSIQIRFKNEQQCSHLLSFFLFRLYLSTIGPIVRWFCSILGVRFDVYTLQSTRTCDSIFYYSTATKKPFHLFRSLALRLSTSFFHLFICLSVSVLLGKQRKKTKQSYKQTTHRERGRKRKCGRTNNQVPIDIYLFFLSFSSKCVYNRFVHRSRELMLRQRLKSISADQMHAQHQYDLFALIACTERC